MAKIDKFTKAQLSTLKKRVKSLREQVKDVKEGEGNSQLTQVRAALFMPSHMALRVAAWLTPDGQGAGARLWGDCPRALLLTPRSLWQQELNKELCTV